MAERQTGRKLLCVRFNKGCKLLCVRFNKGRKLLCVRFNKGRKLLCVCFNKGCEFDNQHFIGYLESKGIRWERVPKDSSSANGVVERANRTVIEGTRTQLEDSGLYKKWWAESASAHCYVCGFIPSSRHPDVIPWQ